MEKTSQYENFNDSVTKYEKNIRDIDSAPENNGASSLLAGTAGAGAGVLHEYHTKRTDAANKLVRQNGYLHYADEASANYGALAKELGAVKKGDLLGMDTIVRQPKYIDDYAHMNKGILDQAHKIGFKNISKVKAMAKGGVGLAAGTTLYNFLKEINNNRKQSNNLDGRIEQVSPGITEKVAYDQWDDGYGIDQHAANGLGAGMGPSMDAGPEAFYNDLQNSQQYYPQQQQPEFRPEFQPDLEEARGAAAKGAAAGAGLTALLSGAIGEHTYRKGAEAAQKTVGAVDNFGVETHRLIEKELGQNSAFSDKAAKRATETAARMKSKMNLGKSLTHGAKYMRRAIPGIAAAGGIVGLTSYMMNKSRQKRENAIARSEYY